MPISAALSISPTNLSFPVEAVGTTSASQTVTLNNNGVTTLTITGIAATGDFAQTNNCGASLAAGAACSVQVTFSPSAVGTRTGTLDFTDSDPSSPQSVPLIGTSSSQTPAPVVILSTSDLNFGDQPVGTTSNTQSIVLINGGGSALSITNITVSPSFGESNNCGSSVPSGAECVINVTFTPSSTGLQAGTLAITDNASSSPQVVTLSGNGTSAPPPLAHNYVFGKADFATGTGPRSAVTGDFNRDGKLDLATVNDADNTVSILLGKADGTFSPKLDIPTGHVPVVLIAADFNGDGNLDLAVVNQYDSTVSILLGKGDGTFQSHVDYGTGPAPVSVTMADFNGDGKLDLAVANGGFGPAPNGTVSVLLGNGDGTFKARVDYVAGNGPISVVAGDFNGDGKFDLAVANANDNTVSVLPGNGGRLFPSSCGHSRGYSSSVNGYRRFQW